MIREEGRYRSGEAMPIFLHSRRGSPSFSGSESLEVGVTCRGTTPRMSLHCLASLVNSPILKCLAISESYSASQFPWGFFLSQLPSACVDMAWFSG